MGNSYRFFNRTIARDNRILAINTFTEESLSRFFSFTCLLNAARNFKYYSDGWNADIDRNEVNKDIIHRYLSGAIEMKSLLETFP